jgi:tetratricopeptide (TPR) repeat protein
MLNCSLLDRATRLETQYRDKISQADEVRERIHILRNLKPATGSGSLLITLLCMCGWLTSLPDSNERDLLLVRALLDQYHQHNSTELLQEVVELCTKDVECSSFSSKAIRNQLLCYLGVAHALLFFDLRRFEDCHAALSALAESRQHLAKQDPLHVLCVSHHSATLLNEWSMTRNDGLGRAFSLLRTIADECTSDHQYRDVYLEILGRLCLAQWSETREGSLLDQAVAAYNECLLIRGDEGCRAINALNGLIVVKQRTSDVTNNPEKLVDIISRARQALSQGIDDGRATYTMVLLAGLLSMHASRGNNPTGFREAKDLAYTSVQRYKDTDYGKYGALHTLSAVLEDWVDFYDTDEVPLDIVDEIVRTQRQVVAFCPPGHTWHERAAIHLVTAYLRRHQYYRDPADLIAAVEVARSTLSMCSEGMHGHASCLYHLARALLQCYEEWSKPSDLSDAIACFDELEGLGQDAWDDDPPYIRCHVLAQALELRYRADNSLADLDRAISLLHQALDILPLDSRMRRPYTMDLVAMLRERFVHTQDSNDAKAVSNTLTRLLDTMPIGDSTRALALVAKARLLVTPGFAGYDVLEAVKLQQAALRDNYRHPQMRLAESLEILSLCKSAIQAYHLGQRTVALELLSAYRSAIQLLPCMASFGLSLHSRFVVLARARTLAAEATLLALELGHICEALEMLEEGRAVFWAQYLRLRTTFDVLPHEQATHLRQLTQELTLGDSDSRGPIGDDEIVKRRKLNADFEEALASARQLPGFERLLMSQTYSSLSQAARNGPVVVFVSSGTHTVAFIVPAPDVTPISVALPNMNEDRLKAMISDHRIASARSAERLREARSMKPVRIRDSGDRDGECQLLANLWSWVMLPVVEALNLRVSTGVECTYHS